MSAVRSRSTILTFAAVAVVGLLLTACGDDSAAPATSSSPSATDSAQAAIDAAPDPCPPGRLGDCRPVAVFDADGSGALASISTHPAGQESILVATGTEKLTAQIRPDDAQLTQPIAPGERAEKIAFYQLDGRPGLEIVVPLGLRGSDSIYQVFSVRDGELVSVTPPGDALNITLGMLFWDFPGERIIARAMCRDGGLSLGSAPAINGQEGRVIDFISKPGTGAGEAGEWIKEGQTRSVPASEVTDMSIGSDHFKCTDLRAKSLLDVTVTTSAKTSPTHTDDPLFPDSPSCDADKDMSAAVREAIASLPEGKGGPWKPTAEVSEASPCKALSFAWTLPEQSSNTSPVAIMLFHKGEFVGPASTCMPSIESIRNTGDDTVTVVYRYLNEGDSNASMTGRATYKFTWRDGKVAMSGEAPARLTKMAGCKP